jgi:hypothetical protein
MNFSRKTTLFVLAIAALFLAACSSLGGAQSAAPAPGDSPAHSDAPVLVARFAVVLNTKSAKAGDPITAKTVKELKLNDLDIPKGSKIVGTVAAAQSMHSGNGNSALAVKFDHVELKGGAILRIVGQIVAIGPGPSAPGGLGFNSVLGRGGVGSTPGLDPNVGADRYNDNDDIPAGSSLQDVALGRHLNGDGATQLRGVHRDIKFDPDVMVKVALYRER